MPPSPSTQKSPVPSVSNAIAVIRFLGQAKEPMGVNPIAKALYLSPSTCFNLLKTLTQEGLLDFDAETKKYTPGIGLMELAGIGRRGDNLISAAVPSMNRLAENYDVVSGFWKVNSDNRLLLVALSDKGAGTRIHMSLGQRQPLFAGAVGRSVVALNAYSSAELRAGFDTVRWQSPLSYDDYCTSLNDVKMQGWAIDESQLLRGVTTIAAGLPAQGDDHARYSISCSMFTGQHSPKTLKEIGEALHSIALRLSSAATVA